MTGARIEIACWCAVAALSAIALLGARPVRRSVAATTVPRIGASDRAPSVDTDAAVSALIATDPFRSARHASPVAYSPEIEGAPPPPPRPPRPGLAVSGIIGGPPWSAVLEGVPGRESGAVVRAGDTLGGLCVRAVRRDTVVITGMDTTWRLIVRRAW
jgi:hypothetical protein